MNFILDSKSQQRYRKKEFGLAYNNRLMELVTERGIKIRLTPDAERQLRQAGA